MNYAYNGNTVAGSASPSDLSDISGLRQQVLGNAMILFPGSQYVDVIVTSAEYPENGHYGARLIDNHTRELLLGGRYALSIPLALGQLLQDTCDAIRDSHALNNFRIPSGLQQ